MLNIMGFRICASNICKKQLVYCRFICSEVRVSQSRQICGEKFRRNYITYHSLFNKELEHNETDEEKGSNLKRKAVLQKVSIILPNDSEKVMLMKDAEAHAKRMNMKLVPEEQRGEKKKYKLVKVSELYDEKLHMADTKRVFFRQEIDGHDLRVKLRQYIKLVLKGYRVLCIVDGKNNTKLDNILNVIKEDEINNYLTQVSKTSTGINIIFQLTKKNTTANESQDENIPKNTNVS